MINSQLALNVAGRFLHRPRRVAEKAVDVVLDETVTVMARKDRVELRAFGAFSVKDKKMHKRLNPVASMPESSWGECSEQSTGSISETHSSSSMGSMTPAK